MAKKSSGINWNDVLLYGGLGVGGILVLKSLFSSSAITAPGASYPAPSLPGPATQPAPGSAEKIATLTSGAPYDINDAIVPGYKSIVLFATDTCPACQEMKPLLQQLVQSRNDVVLRVVDLTNRNSPAAAQAVQEFDITGIPYMRVYGPSGEFRGEVIGPNIDQIQALL